MEEITTANSSFTVINNKTGEVVNENFKMDTVEDEIRRLKFYNKNLTSSEFKEYQSKELGDFVFLIFENIDKLTEILNDSELVRYIYIGTYIKSNGYLQLDNNLDYINKSKLREIMNTNRTTFANLYNKLLRNNLIEEERFMNYKNINGEMVVNGYDENRTKIKINFDYLYKGNLIDYRRISNVSNKKMGKYIRLYVKKIRELYDCTEGRSVRKLAIIYKLLPYISWKHNILCHNTNELDHRELQLLTLGDVVNYLGYDKTKISRFRKDFYSLKCNGDHIFMSLQKGTSDVLESFIAVNPKFMYGGDNLNEVDWLIKSFESGAKSKKIRH